MLENIVIEQTRTTPGVVFDQDHGLLEIEGSSIMEDAREFYSPLVEWIGQYIENPKNTIVKINLEYFNTPTNIFLQILFKDLSSLRQKNAVVTVLWFYDKDDEDIWESGNRFSELSKLDFNYIIRRGKKIERIEIEATDSSPAVLLDPDKGIISLRGKSTLETVKTFYTPVIEWLNSYILNARDTNAFIHLESYNQTTKKFLHLLFNDLAVLKQKGKKVNIHWQKDFNLSLADEEKFLMDLILQYELNIVNSDHT